MPGRIPAAADPAGDAAPPPWFLYTVAFGMDAAETPAPEDAVHVPGATIWLREDGLLQCRILDGAALDVDAVQAALSAFARLTGGRRLPVLIDVVAYANASIEARRLGAGSEMARHVSAIGIVVRSPVMRVVATFFTRVARPAVPCKVFLGEGDARAWLGGFLGNAA